MVIVFLAAIVRGYSGFGFSLLAITALTLIFEPARVIPAIFMLEIAASIHMLPAIWREIHWRSIGFLLIGTLVGTPVGVYALANVPQAGMTMALAIFVLSGLQLMVVLDGSVVILALPRLQQEMGLSSSGSAWTVVSVPDSVSAAQPSCGVDPSRAYWSVSLK